MTTSEWFQQLTQRERKDVSMHAVRYIRTGTRAQAFQIIRSFTKNPGRRIPFFKIGMPPQSVALDGTNQL